ncbi:MAG: Ig-like domain-containing protein [Candidatus Alcyoniella australis]|nr:Ig-like domain-containing protein [Candidatus Alcyoniella australis]
MQIARRLIPILLLAALLFGCQGEELEDLNPPWTSGALQIEMCMPYIGQQNVSLAMRPVIIFDKPVDQSSLAGQISLARVDDGVETELPIELAVDGRSVWIDHEPGLEQLTDYVIHFGDRISGIDGRRFTGLNVSFSTEGHNPIAGRRPEVIALMPIVDNRVYEIATLWAAFSEPIQTATVVYGDTVRLTRDSDESLVPTTIWPGWTVMTIDPDEYLIVGESYTLTIGSGIEDLNGESLIEYVYGFTALFSGELVDLTVTHCPSANDPDTPCGNTEIDDLPTSKVTGRSSNTFYTISKLIGEGYVYHGGPLRSVMGGAETNPDITPVLLPRGQQVNVSALGVSLGGELSTGVTSGPMTLTLLSDVYGFQLGAEYLYGSPGGKPGMYMILDTALVAQTPLVNAMFSQNILGTQLVGTSEVNPQTGDLFMDLGSYITLDLLGERATTVVSLSYQPPKDPYDFEPDTTPPSVVSVGPVPDSDNAPLTEPVTVTFDDVVLPASLEGKIRLRGGTHEGLWKFRGTTAVFHPSQPLEPLTQYTLMVDAGIEDMLGNAMEQGYSSTFTTRASEASAEAPTLGTTSPSQGGTHAVDMPVDLFFGQAIDRDSVEPGVNVSMIDVSSGGAVDGSWLVGFHQVRFIPNEQFTPGSTYRLTIGDSITNVEGVRLDTEPNRLAGGPDIEIEFNAVESLGYIPLVLMIAPVADADDSGFLGIGEQPTPENSISMDIALIKESSYASGIMVAFARGLEDVGGRQVFGLDLGAGILMHVTSTSIELALEKGSKEEPGLLDMGRIIIASTDPGSADIYDLGDGGLGLDILMQTEFSVENELLNGFLVHELVLSLDAAMDFTADGRMATLISGQSTIIMDVPIIGRLEIPADVRMRAVTPQLERP